MREFTDSQGRTWRLQMTIGALKRVRNLTGIDLLGLSDGSPPLLTRLGTDVVLLIDTIFALLKPDADAAGVTDEEFGASLGGEAAQNAQKAFYEELADFLRGLGRAELARAVTTQADLMKAAVAEADGILAKINPTQEVKRIFGPASTSSPESAA